MTAPLWDLSCKDWESRIRTGASLIPALPLNLVEGDRAVAIFDRLRLPDVPGNPSMAEAAGAWFRELVRALFGSITPAGVRMIREFFALLPKKNSKTTNGAELMLTALLMNRRPRAEFLLIGPTQAVSELAFDQVDGSIALDSVLKKRLHPQWHLKAITNRLNGAELKIKTFAADVLTGVKPAGVLVDELHQIAKTARAAQIIGQIRGGLLPYPEAFLGFITTQSDEPPMGAFKAELQMARAIRDGRAAGAMLPLLYEFPPDIARDQAQWGDPANWPMVLPNLGRSISIERLAQDFDTAKLKGDEEVRRWASQHLNIEIGLGLHSDRWAGADFWERNGNAALTLDRLIARSEVVVVGIDGGGLDDLLGLAVLGRERGTGRWLLWSRAWAHRIVLERRQAESPRLLDFAAAGELVIVDLPGDDVDEVADIVCRIEAEGLLADEFPIGVDAVGIGDIVDALTAEGRGIALGRIMAVSQGWKLSGAIKTTERKLAGGELEHGASALMDWCVGNAKAEARGNALTITKAAAGSAKIDPLVALFNAVAVMARNPAAAGASVYDDIAQRPAGFLVL